MKQGHDKNQIGERIDNIPNSGTLNGNWIIDHYGCWWEYKLDRCNSFDGRQPISWIIGEYPEDY